MHTKVIFYMEGCAPATRVCLETSLNSEMAYYVTLKTVALITDSLLINEQMIQSSLCLRNLAAVISLYFHHEHSTSFHVETEVLFLE